MELKRTLRDAHRAHRWKDLPSICKGCGDWQTAGADYEPEQVDGTRPFWFNDEGVAVSGMPDVPGA
jgi:hypothetical protein